MSIMFAAETAKPAKLGVPQLSIKSQGLKAQGINEDALAATCTCFVLSGIHKFGPQVLTPIFLADPQKRNVQIPPISPGRQSTHDASRFIPNKNAKALDVVLRERRVIRTGLSNDECLVLFARMVGNLKSHDTPP